MGRGSAHPKEPLTPKRNEKQPLNWPLGATDSTTALWACAGIPRRSALFRGLPFGLRLLALSPAEQQPFHPQGYDFLYYLQRQSPSVSTFPQGVSGIYDKKD